MPSRRGVRVPGVSPLLPLSRSTTSLPLSRAPSVRRTMYLCGIPSPRRSGPRAYDLKTPRSPGCQGTSRLRDPLVRLGRNWISTIAGRIAVPQAAVRVRDGETARRCLDEASITNRIRIRPHLAVTSAPKSVGMPDGLVDRLDPFEGGLVGCLGSGRDDLAVTDWSDDSGLESRALGPEVETGGQGRGAWLQNESRG